MFKHTYIYPNNVRIRSKPPYIKLHPLLNWGYCTRNKRCWVDLKYVHYMLIAYPSKMAQSFSGLFSMCRIHCQLHAKMQDTAVQDKVGMFTVHWDIVGLVHK